MIALTRDVSPSLGDCELTFLEREPIDLQLARQQHQRYRRCLASLGARSTNLDAHPGLPDCVFVEDTAVVVDEVAVITRPGAASRRGETSAIAEELASHRRLEFLVGPDTLEGGDVIRAGSVVFVGQSTRTNAGGLQRLTDILGPHGYEVVGVPVSGALHLKTACSFPGDDWVLFNPDWVDAAAFQGIRILEVARGEGWAACTVRVGDTVVMAAGYPRTEALLSEQGFKVRSVDISEFEKAEAGVSCLSILFEA